MTGSDTAALPIPVNGVELAVQVAGSGPPIVLVHGSLDDHRAWERIVPQLADSHSVVTYDRRGHGGSSCPPGQGRISEDVEDLAGVLHTLELERRHVVRGGHAPHLSHPADFAELILSCARETAGRAAVSRSCPGSCGWRW
jgi:alpha-beta hydrolase superfamily lysophospholipase